MSLVKRFIRLLQASSVRELQMRDLVGIVGEQYAAQFLDPTVVTAYVANPVLPHPNNGQKYLETDLLVYAAGTLFCVEVKNYRGIRCEDIDPERGRRDTATTSLGRFIACQ